MDDNTFECDACAGHGWLLVALEGDDERLAIQRCDACEQFESDQAAIVAVDALARKCWGQEE